MANFSVIMFMMCFRPYLFVATQKHVRIYDLAKQVLTSLIGNCQFIGSIGI
jgi:hypothetical protein